MKPFCLGGGSGGLGEGRGEEGVSYHATYSAIHITVQSSTACSQNNFFL